MFEASKFILEFNDFNKSDYSIDFTFTDKQQNALISKSATGSFFGARVQDLYNSNKGLAFYHNIECYISMDYFSFKQLRPEFMIMKLAFLNDWNIASWQTSNVDLEEISETSNQKTGFTASFYNANPYGLIAALIYPYKARYRHNHEDFGVQFLQEMSVITDFLLASNKSLSIKQFLKEKTNRLSID